MTYPLYIIHKAEVKRQTVKILLKTAMLGIEDPVEREVSPDSLSSEKYAHLQFCLLEWKGVERVNLAN
jgi:hypothetical protein